MRTTRNSLGALLIAAAGHAPAADPTLELARYSTNAAGFSALVTYCTTKYGPIAGQSPGAQCFARGKGALAKADLNAAARTMAAKCPDPATFSACMTPHLGSTVVGLLSLFDANGV